MTRENKLALVVGFALILVVGILISDHFSTARSQRSAELGSVVDPTQPDSGARAQLIEFDSGPRSQPLLQPGRVDHRPAGTTTRRDGTTTGGYVDVVRTPPGSVQDPLAGQPRSPIEVEPAIRQNLPFTYHHVKPSETLTSISRHYFGDDSLVRELAEFNDLANPDSVPVGMRLRIPKTDALIRGEPTRVTLEQLEQLVERAPATTPAVTEAIYTVQKGDTLGEIALSQLGTSRRWRELYEFNKDVIRNPNTVVVGTQLRIPR